MEVTSLRSRWLWVIALGASVVWLGSAGPGGPGEAPRPSHSCAAMVEVQGLVARRGLVCADALGLGEDLGLGELLSRAGGVVGCTYDPAAPASSPPTPMRAGATVDVGEGEGTCVIRRGLMDGERLLALGLPIDVNLADATSLDALPGIGVGLANRIIAERARGGQFTDVESLRRVRGIGPKTLEKLRPFVHAAQQHSDRAAAGSARTP